MNKALIMSFRSVARTVLILSIMSVFSGVGLGCHPSTTEAVRLDGTIIVGSTPKRVAIYDYDETPLVDEVVKLCSYKKLVTIGQLRYRYSYINTDGDNRRVETSVLRYDIDGVQQCPGKVGADDKFTSLVPAKYSGELHELVDDSFKIWLQKNMPDGEIFKTKGLDIACFVPIDVMRDTKSKSGSIIGFLPVYDSRATAEKLHPNSQIIPLKLKKHVRFTIVTKAEVAKTKPRKE